MFGDWKQPICIVKTRPLQIPDIPFSLRTKRTSYSSLESLTQAGLVYELKPEDEQELLNTLVALHPVEQKNFEHFLNNPPSDVLPSQIKKALEKRTRLIPTLFIVYFYKNGEPRYIEKVTGYYHLLSILSEAREDGLVPPEMKEKAVG